jgi:uncharacterized protein (DUF305 family)
MKKINTNVLYAIIGFLIGVIITGATCLFNQHRGWGKGDYSRKDKSSMMHRMPDGTMMNNVGMDMHSMMGGMMATLEGKTGDDFDKAFISEMIVHHQGAVDMAQSVLKQSKRPDLIKLANDIITAQNKEIKMMQDWQKAWFQ